MTAPTITRARGRTPAATESVDATLPAELVPRVKRVKLSPARRRALEALAERHRRGRTGRVSNSTDADEGLVYWQSAAWLIEQGLAEGIEGATGYPSNTYLRITPAGLDQLQ